MKNVSGLMMDAENAEGAIKFPRAFHSLESIAALDVLSDWMFDLREMQAHCHKMCFMDLIAPGYSKESSFEDAYSAYLSTLVQLDLDPPTDDGKAQCAEIFADYTNIMKENDINKRQKALADFVIKSPL